MRQTTASAEAARAVRRRGMRVSRLVTVPFRLRSCHRSSAGPADGRVFAPKAAFAPSRGRRFRSITGEMARMTPHQRLELALGILAELPTTLEVLSDDGGSVTIELNGHDSEMLHALAQRSRVRLGLGLRLRTRTPEGRGYDVDMSVSELFFHAAGVAAMHLTVERVRRFNGNRATPRARVDDLAFVGVLYSSMPLDGQEFDVRMMDVSPDGMAFITD